MKFNDLNIGKEALIKLNNVKFNDFKIAMKVFKLTKSVNENIEFFTTEYNKLIDLYKPEKLQNGSMKFDSVENRTKFESELNTLLNTELETNIEKIEIPLASVENAKDFSGNDIMALSPFVEWLE